MGENFSIWIWNSERLIIKHLRGNRSTPLVNRSALQSGLARYASRCRTYKDEQKWDLVFPVVLVTY